MEYGITSRAAGLLSGARAKGVEAVLHRATALPDDVEEVIVGKLVSEAQLDEEGVAQGR